MGFPRGSRSRAADSACMGGWVVASGRHERGQAWRLGRQQTRNELNLNCTCGAAQFGLPLCKIRTHDEAQGSQLMGRLQDGGGLIPQQQRLLCVLHGTAGVRLEQEHHYAAPPSAAALVLASHQTQQQQQGPVTLADDFTQSMHSLPLLQAISNADQNLQPGKEIALLPLRSHSLPFHPFSRLFTLSSS